MEKVLGFPGVDVCRAPVCKQVMKVSAAPGLA
jgi:hypothetical protein